MRFFYCSIIMTTTPSTRFSKTYWLNFHHNHCSKIAKDTFEIIFIGDLILAGLSRYQNVWDKFLKPLKALNCVGGGKRIQYVLWYAFNLPVFSNLKNIVILCGTNNFLLDSPNNIADGILKRARSFKTNYRWVNLIICDILSHDNSWTVGQVSIKEFWNESVTNHPTLLLVMILVGLFQMVPLMHIFIIQIDYT